MWWILKRAEPLPGESSDPGKKVVSHSAANTSHIVFSPFNSHCSIKTELWMSNHMAQIVYHVSTWSQSGSTNFLNVVLADTLYQYVRENVCWWALKKSPITSSSINKNNVRDELIREIFKTNSVGGRQPVDSKVTSDRQWRVTETREMKEWPETVTFSTDKRMTNLSQYNLGNNNNASKCLDRKNLNYSRLKWHK